MIYLIKNVVNKIILALSDIYIRHFGGKNQFLPSLEDIENEELKKLANGLEGDSNKKTLTNILEWQHNNLLYWMERGILETSWIFLTPFYFFLCIFVVTIISIIIYLILLPFLGTAWSINVGLLIFITFLALLIFQGTLIKAIFALLFFYPVYEIMKILFMNSPSKNAIINTGLTIASFNGVLFGASLFTIIYMTLSYLPLFRGYPIKDKFLKLLSILNDTFKLSLSVEKIINYRLAICRDYAKFTAALFFNYPDSKVYFFTIRSHVATAVKVNGECYILDQKLPVLTKDGWLKRWNVKEANVYASELVQNSKGEMVAVNIKKHEKISLSNISMKDNNTPNMAEFTDKVSNLLGINQTSQKDVPNFNYLLKDYAVYYEDNDIVKHSLSRAIKNKLENEFCGNVDKISKIEISQCENNKDLNLSVYL